MLDIQIDHLGFESRPYCTGAFTSSGKGALTKQPESGQHLISAVFGHSSGFCGNSKTCRLLVPEHGLVAQGTAPAPSAGTTVQGVNLHVIGLSDGWRVRPARPGWPPGRRPLF